MNYQPDEPSADRPLEEEVLDRFGVLPNFFRLAPDSPDIVQNLWGFAKAGYLDNPLPSLFKERLFVYLSRYCDVRYCIARHVGFLIGLGRPSGDRLVSPESLDEILQLIRRPLPSSELLSEQIEALREIDLLPELPSSDSPLEEAVFSCATHVFLQSPEAPRCLEALRLVLDSDTHQHLLLFLAFVRTAHFWTKVHPELQEEADIKELLTVHESLAECVLREPDPYSDETTQILLTELAHLRQERQQAELLRVTLSSIGDAVIATDPHGLVTNMNIVAEELTGWPLDEAIGQPLETVFRIVNEETGETVENPAKRSLREGVIVGLANHTILIARDGARHPIDDSAAPIRKDDLIVGCVLVFRDVTERREAEEELAEQARLMSMRADISAALATADTVQTVLQRCAMTLVKHLNMAFVRIWTLNEADDVLELQASAGLYTHLDGPHGRVKVGEFKIGRIARDREPLLTNDVPHDPNISNPEWAKQEGMNAFAGYPLIIGERVVGVLAMFSRPTLSETMLTNLGPLAEAIAQYLDRKQTEAALAESELRYRLIGQAANDAIWDWNLVTNEVAWNEGLQARFGYKPHQIGNDAVWWYEHIHPEDRERVVHSIHEAIDGGETYWTEEYRYRREDGTHAVVCDRGQIVRDENGKPGRMVGSMLDLTERIESEERLRESEEKIRLMADTIPNLAWMAQPDGNIFWYNQPWYEYTGLTPEEVQGWGWQSIHDPDVLPEVIARWNESLVTGQPFNMVFPLKGADGKFRPFLTRVNPLHDESGGIRYWFGTNTDISEQQETQARLREIAAQLSEADRRKDEFLATLAHELRNPLAPIRMGLEAMRVFADDPETIEEIRTTMERQTHQLIALVDDLLDVSRITRGKLELRRARVEVKDVVASAVEASTPFIKEAGHTLSLSIPEDSMPLDADPHRLSQVLSNLLNNAAKYTPEGGTIDLRAEKRHDKVVLSVKDNGIGIPQEMRDRIFEMFAQIERPMEKGYTGLGIGLTLVKSLVEMHNGHVEVHSEGEDQGSEFVVRLPLAGASAAQPTIRKGMSNSRTTETKRKVLIVDDNLPAAQMLSLVVKMLGSEIQLAGDGQEAIDVAAEFLPDVILMDLGMPRMNGYEAARHIRNQPWGQDMLLVALTGWGQDEDKQRTREAGFDHHLTKPAEPATLNEIFAAIDERRG
ncbi:PAS domain S-box protein [Rubinisphaera margarita]|uniref:PAS domain S-box protein n=1 Tax=Rubinisphaera margarita TaxID=2909586 RepID=UPI001EE8AEA4|nr:PAS domain S-box protein [Rubinisphaera margarita]MCG6156631.1 PAS domain S-box protein [Rubinisphaera margarita]